MSKTDTDVDTDSLKGTYKYGDKPLSSIKEELPSWVFEENYVLGRKETGVPFLTNEKRDFVTGALIDTLLENDIEIRSVEKCFDGVRVELYE